MKATELIQEDGARSAPKVLRVIERQMSDLKAMAITADHGITNKSLFKRKQNKNYRSNVNDASIHDNVRHQAAGDDKDGDVASKNISLMSSSTATEEEFTFLYEEEADPEVFFVPYIWDLIVSVVTAGIMEWKTDDIKVFALLEGVHKQNFGVEQSPVDLDAPATTGNFSLNADEMV